MKVGWKIHGLKSVYYDVLYEVYAILTNES